MSTTSDAPVPVPPGLVDGLVEELRALGALRSPRVEAAVRGVPRHRFMPEADLVDVYRAEHALVTKRDARGVSLSSVSAARIQVFMAEQAGLGAGMRVLEIGSGGYNAALLAELVGPEGHVWSVDIDPDVIDRARRLLDTTGYGRVSTRTADGFGGVADGAPFDRVVVTVETPDLAPAWVEQLTPAGRLVAPLRLRGLTRSIAFDRAPTTSVPPRGPTPMTNCPRPSGAPGRSGAATNESAPARARTEHPSPSRNSCTSAASTVTA